FTAGGGHYDRGEPRAGGTWRRRRRVLWRVRIRRVGVRLLTEKNTHEQHERNAEVSPLLLHNGVYRAEISTMNPSGSSRLPAMKSPLISVTHSTLFTNSTPTGLIKPEATRCSVPSAVTRYTFPSATNGCVIGTGISILPPSVTNSCPA